MRQVHGPLTPKQLEHQEAIFRSAQRLTELINDLLDVSRLEAARVELDPRPIDVREAVDHVVAAVRVASQAKQIRIANAVGSAGPVVQTPGSESVENASGSIPGANASGSEAKRGAFHLVLEQERIRRLVENLRTAEQAAAAEELVQKGASAVPALLDALERRDVELRRQAFCVLQMIHEPAQFDPFAPEVLRRQQIAELRDQFQRRAG